MVGSHDIFGSPSKGASYIRLTPLTNRSRHLVGSCESPNMFGSQYDSFFTIDWHKNAVEEHQRQRSLKLARSQSICGYGWSIWDCSSGWVCVCLIGILVGICAMLVDIGTSWLSDVKEGICLERFWFNREQCCWSINSTTTALLYTHNESDVPSSMNRTIIGGIRVTRMLHSSPTGTVEDLSNSTVNATNTTTYTTTSLPSAQSTPTPSPTLNVKVSSVPGSGATAISGLYACDQWYSWEKLLTGHNGGKEHPGAYLLGYLIYIVWAVLFAGVSALLVRTFAPYATGSGVSEIKTILGGFLIHGFLGPWTLLTKVVTLVPSVATGLCIGYEAPMIHVAAAWADLVALVFPKYRRNAVKRLELLSASVAAGLAASFGAPIGGVMFSLEEASYYFPQKTLFRCFFCALAAAYTARAINPFGVDHLIMFSVNYDINWHFVELIPFALLGVIGGGIGALCIRGHLYLTKLRRRRFQRWPILQLLLFTGLFAMVSYPHPDLRPPSKHLIRQLVDVCNPGDPEDICDYIRLAPTAGAENATQSAVAVFGSYPAGPRMLRGALLLLFALVVKSLGLIVACGMPIPAGVLLPSITVGSIFGRLVGIGVEQVAVALMPHYRPIQQMCKSGLPCIDPGLYAVVGAAACLGGITRTTISLVILIIELIGGLGHILPIMVAAMCAKWTTDALQAGSIYDAEIRLNGYPYLGCNELLNTWKESIAADIMNPKPGSNPLVVFTETPMTLEAVDKILSTYNYNGFPIVVSPESSYIVGFVSRTDLVRALAQERRLVGDELNALTIVSFADSQTISTPEVDVLSDRGEGELNDPSINLRQIVDLSPATVTDQTSVETLMDMFRKLGLRQALVTSSGLLQGIITKKDLLRFEDVTRTEAH